VCVPIAVLAFILTYAVDVPYWDEWGFGNLLLRMAAGHDPLRQLWTYQNNEHRMPFPAALMVGLTAFGGWHSLREMVCSFAVTCLSLILIIELVRRTIPAALQAPAILIDTLLLFSLVQADSWLAGFQLAWYVMDCAVVVMVWLLSDERLGTGRVIAAGVAAFVAAFSGIAGLLTLPLGLALLAFRSPRPYRALVAWLVFSAATLALYISGNALAGKPSTAYVAQGAWDIVLYPLAYLGSPLAEWAGPFVSAATGFAGLALFVAFAWRAFRLRRSTPRAFAGAAPWLALALYAILSAILTGFGRVGLGVGEALAGRYTILAALLWVGLAGLAAPWYESARVSRSNVATWGARAVLLVAFAGFIGSQVKAAPFAAGSAAARRTGLLAVRHLPAASDADLQTLFPDPNYVRTLVPQLESIGQAPFARPAAN
jgi:hypothetical protein